MNSLLNKWHNLSIRAKSFFLVGVMLAVMWILVALVLIQFQSFSRKSHVIMNDYSDVTGFLDAYSEENVWLEAYIRPSLDAGEHYRRCINQTDQHLAMLGPQWSSQASQAENALRHAIGNAMETYRTAQARFLTLDKQTPEFIQAYLSLKTQSAYIDGYARELLYTRMAQGSAQYQQAEDANLHSMRIFVLYMFCASLLLFLVLTVFARSILRPLMELSRAAAEIGAGRYDAPPLPVCGQDELGTTAQSFNLMQSQIRTTIQALEHQSEMEKHLRETEQQAAQMQRALQEGRFAQLQSQINPHFLFNNLSTIAALAREEGAPLSEDLILRLSSFFRYSLESDERTVTLGREIQLLRDYMELQETRYAGRIKMEILSPDPSLETCTVPKFILQPLVENAILHGLKQRTQGGHIRVRVRRGRRGGICVTVTDNGCGFDPKHRPRQKEHRSVGLQNIAERMELSGGRLDVFSIPGLGTTARITVKEHTA